MSWRTFDLMAYAKILASPLVGGVVLGYVSYEAIDGAWRYALASILPVVGLLLGVLWAERHRRRHTLTEFAFRDMKVPEIEPALGAPDPKTTGARRS